MIDNYPEVLGLQPVILIGSSITNSWFSAFIEWVKRRTRILGIKVCGSYVVIIQLNT
jgi:hypothetical protein